MNTCIKSSIYDLCPRAYTIFNNSLIERQRKRERRKGKEAGTHSQLQHLFHQVLCIMRKEFASYYISDGNFARKDSKFGAGELSSTYFERQVAGGRESRWRGRIKGEDLIIA